MTGVIAPPTGLGADAAAVLLDGQRICLVAAPTFAEGERAALVAELLREAGAAPSRDDVGNVVCRFGPPGPAHVLAAHLDTVFTADTPLAIRSEPGRLCAPGLGDNAIGVAAIVDLARMLAATPPSQPVVLAANVGEEGLGDLRGAKHLVASLECATFIAVEGANLEALRHGGIGSTRLRVTVEGPGGHPWGDRGAPSAVHGLIGTTERMLRWFDAFRAETGDVDLVVNVGRIEGGTSINTIAAAAMLELDLRGRDPAALARLSARAGEIFRAPGDGLSASVETIGQRPTGEIASNHPLVVLARRVRAAAGLAPALEEPASTDANAAFGAGIPALSVGVTTGGNAHRLDEFIDIAPLDRGVGSLRALVTELAGEKLAG